MSKLDSMWFFQKISLGLALVNSIMLAMADKRITAAEVVGFVNVVIAAIAPDLKIDMTDIQIIENPDGSCSIVLSKKLMDKLSFGV